MGKSAKENIDMRRNRSFLWVWDFCSRPRLPWHKRLRRPDKRLGRAV